jgi:hypothetical protein
VSLLVKYIEGGLLNGGMGAATDGMESGRMDSEVDGNRHWHCLVQLFSDQLF